MFWYRYLYVGERAKRYRSSIIRGIREKRYCPGVYVITPPSNGNNTLDIYPQYMLLLGGYRDREFHILGIAVGRREALNLAGTIVSDMYALTGGFCLDRFLTERGSRV